MLPVLGCSWGALRVFVWFSKKNALGALLVGMLLGALGVFWGACGVFFLCSWGARGVLLERSLIAFRVLLGCSWMLFRLLGCSWCVFEALELY